MNRLHILFIVFATTAFCFGQEKKIKAYLDSKQFYAPGEGNYIEFYLQFVGATAKYVTDSSGHKAKLALAYEIKKGETVVKQDAYVLESPVAKDSIQEDFFDLKRFSLDPGEYTLVLDVVDLNRDKSAIHASQTFTIEDRSKSVSISDLEIAELAYASDKGSVFEKSGLYILPLISTFFPSELNKIPYYLEVYNANQSNDTSIALVQKIINASSGLEMENYTFAEILRANQVIPYFKTIDITNLKTGSYILEISILDRNMNRLCISDYAFERSNDRFEEFNIETVTLDPAFQESIVTDSVQFYLACLIPIAKPAESKNIIQTLKLKNEEKSRKHIQAFWIQVSADRGGKAYDEWLKYKEQVKMVERLYSTNFQDGFETDRGRVYLKYGAPSTVITKEVSASEYPYEIWTYDKVGIYSNRRFLFYNPDLVNNAYRLLHSDMLGERKTPGWAQVLSSRNTNQGDVDNPNKYLSPSVGNNSQDFFRQY
ncbi:MAG: GWxTD domain-containing protein [Bacteroidetes bacterium]|nr:GWxTD domain-containing protein [Bacteroidota bacterium]